MSRSRDPAQGNKNGASQNSDRDEHSDSAAASSSHPAASPPKHRSRSKARRKARDRDAGEARVSKEVTLREPVPAPHVEELFPISDLPVLKPEPQPEFEFDPARAARTGQNGAFSLSGELGDDLRAFAPEGNDSQPSTLDDPEAARLKLSEELPAWTPQEDGDQRRFKRRRNGTANDSLPSTPGELKLAQIELREAIEGLIDPKFRFNIAGREFAASEEGVQHFDENVLIILGDFFRLLVRRCNQRIDDMLLSKKVRLSWARLRGRKLEAEALREDVAFIPLEVALVNGDGKVLSSASRDPRNATLPILLKSAPPSFFSLVASPGRYRRRPKLIQTRLSSKLSRLSEINDSVRKNYVVCRGSKYALVASVQGIAPRRFRDRLRLATKAIGQGLAKRSAAPGGNLSSGREEILQRYLREIVNLAPRHLESPTRWIQGAGIASVFLLFTAVAGAGLSLWHLYRWNHLVAVVERVPGIEVTHATAWTRPPSMTGLRDRLAPDPLTIVQQHGFFVDEVDLSFTPYHSAHPRILERRAHQTLQPPDSVTLRFTADRIYASGSATNAWLQRSERARTALPPHLQLDLSDVANVNLETCRTTANHLLSHRLIFDPKDPVKPLVLDDTLEEITGIILQLQEDAGQSDIDLSIRLVGRFGHPTEPFGPAHLAVSAVRADNIRNLLLSSEPAINAALLTSLGERPLGPTERDIDRRNQAVEFVVSLNDEVLVPAGKETSISAARIGQ